MPLIPMSCPPGWRKAMVSRGMATVLFALVATDTSSAVRGIMLSGMHVSHIYQVCTAFLTASCAVLTMLCRGSRFTCIEACTWVVLATFAAPMIVMSESSSDVIWRHRTQTITFCLGMALPQYFGMPLCTYVPYSLWVLALNIAALHSFDEVAPLRMYSTLSLGCAACIAMCRHQGQFFSMLYRAELALTFERDATESLVSMFCDAHFWLASDEETVISSDNRFTSLLGRNMVGEVIKTCFGIDTEDWPRLQKVFSEAPLDSKPAPVTVLPVTLCAASGQISVDMYVVGCRGHQVGNKEEGRRAYLIGICLKGEPEWQTAGRDLLGNSNVMNLVPAIEAAPDAAWGSEVPTSAPTGAIFHERESNPDVARTLQEVNTLGKKEHWVVDKAELKLVPSRVYGEGSFGLVVRANFYGAAVAVKISRKPLNMSNKEDFSQLCNELRILRRLRHPHLVQLMGAVVDEEESRLALVLEAVEGRDLNAFMEVGQGPSLLARCQVMKDICSALRYLHSRSPRVVHGDLKSCNVLLEHDGLHWKAKLVDFGLSRLLTGNPLPLGGTLRYMAPEVFLKTDQSPHSSVDVFSFGRIAFFLLTKRRPLSSLTTEQIREAFRKKSFPVEAWPEDSLSKARSQVRGRSMVVACLHPTPSSRPCMNDVHAMLEKCFESLNGCGRTGAPRGHGGKEMVSQLDFDGYDWHVGLQYLLHAGGPPESNSESQGGRKEAKLVDPKLRGTPLETRRLIMKVVMGQWNYAVPDALCCSFHAGTLALQRSVIDLQGLPCRIAPRAYNGQCAQCGLLCDQGDCDLCDDSQEADEVSEAEAARPGLARPSEAQSVAPASAGTLRLQMQSL